MPCGLDSDTSGTNRWKWGMGMRGNIVGTQELVFNIIYVEGPEDVTDWLALIPCPVA